MKDLQAVYQECIDLLDSIGMDYGNITEVTVNYRAKRRWGQCRHDFVGWAANGDKRYSHSINISAMLLDDSAPIKALKNTIIHEILHTCPGCNNHGINWKQRAEKVRNELGFDIQRCGSADDKGIPESVYLKYDGEPKYKIKCVRCGHIYTRDRMCRLVKYPHNWKCGGCGGSLERIK